MTTWRLSVVVVGVLVLAAPGVASAQVVEAPDSGAVTEASVADAGATGLGALDAVDAGSPDAGPGVDATPSDAGMLAAETTLSPDAGAPAVAAPTEAPKKKPLPKGFTGIVGVVTDALSGEGLIEATVKVVAGGKKSALTDVDGEYRLKLPPGTYDLRIFYALYEGRRVQNVEVKAGEVTRLDVRLEAKSTAIKEVVVEAKADKRNESALLMERKKAP
nr:carboxypeptidase-like regulatory domain-containing protein [Myxococcaceae bacterium]